MNLRRVGGFGWGHFSCALPLPSLFLLVFGRLLLLGVLGVLGIGCGTALPASGRVADSSKSLAASRTRRLCG